MMKVYSVIVVVVTYLLGSFLQVECRQAIKPIGDLKVTDKTFSALHGGPCRLDIQEDLSKSYDLQPLYIIPDTNEIWNPDRNGYLEIPEGASIELFCSSSFANTTANGNGKIFKNVKSIRPTCLEKQTFSWQSEKFRFEDFSCTKPIKFQVEQIGEQCAETGELFRVGYNITKNRFIESMRICYDEKIGRNHYTLHRLIPASANSQYNVSRTNFITAGFFKNYNVNYYYQRRIQKQQVSKHNKNIDLNTFFNDDDFLARGHLAAKADFVYAKQQQATFLFLNVAPQWQSFNNGQWKILEIEVRRFVKKNNLDVDCYTGTWGTQAWKSPGSTAEGQPFYLGYDNNNNGILPVPKLYYRVIIDRKNPKRGIALLGVNNPHATMRDILESYVICDDIATSVPWLRWIRNKKLEKGYIYACTVSQATRALKVLPKSLENVDQILA